MLENYRKRLARAAFLTLGLAAFLAACVKKLDLKSEDKKWETLVVDGGLTDGGLPQILRLWHPSRVGLRHFDAVKNAEVIVHEVGGASEKLRLIGPADSVQYQFDGAVVQPVAGREYWLEIKLENGKTYRSAPERLPVRVGIDSILTRPEFVDEVGDAAVVFESQKVSLIAASKKPTDRAAFLRYDGSLAYVFNEFPKPPLVMLPTRTCFIFDFFNRNNIALQDFGSVPTGAESMDLVGRTAWDWRFEWKQNFTVVQFSITPEAFDFWKKTQSVLSKTGSILDTPAGELRSNVVCDQDPTELVLGYFELAATDTARIVRYFNEYGEKFVLQEPRCRGVDNAWPPVNLPECWDCRIIKNSSTKEPWFWK